MEGKYTKETKGKGTEGKGKGDGNGNGKGNEREMEGKEGTENKKTNEMRCDMK